MYYESFKMAASMSGCALVTSVMQLSQAADDERLIAKINDHYFNSALTVLLPGKAPVPSKIIEHLGEQMSYKLKGLPLYRFLEMPFIKAFLEQGNVYALSRNTKIVCHDCAAITPSGWLILHLTRNTYLELGLEAVKQTHIQKKKDMFVVKINLLSESFRPGKKGYERVLWCLKDRLNLVFDFWLAWEPRDSKVCKSSVAVYFADLCDGVEKAELEKSLKVLTSLASPHISASELEGSNTACGHEEIFEWMGALACGVDMRKADEGSDNYVSTFFCPEPSYNIPRCNLFQVAGFITPEAVAKILASLREHAASQADSLPIMLIVHGFLNSPVAWKTTVRDTFIPCENLYSVLLLPDQKCWFMTAG